MLCRLCIKIVLEKTHFKDRALLGNSFIQFSQTDSFKLQLCAENFNNIHGDSIMLTLTWK